MAMLARPDASSPSSAARAWSSLDRVGTDLAAALRLLAERKRQTLPLSLDFARDLRTIRLLDDLAGDAPHLSPRVALLHESILASATLARTYARHRVRLLDAVGVAYVPVDADDLVRWLVRQVAELARRDREAGTIARPQGAGVRFVLDLSAGFSIVAPLMAFRQGRVASAQWHDRAFAASHRPLDATLQALRIRAGGRSGPVPSADIAFVPAGSHDTCHVTVAGQPGQEFPQVGGTLAVVPRGQACDVPLIPSAIGDPVLSVALAAAMLAFGLACLTLWSTLRRRCVGDEPRSLRPRPPRSACPGPRPRPAP